MFQFISLHESENKNAPEPKLQFEFTDSINTKPKELESPPRNIYISNEIPDSLHPLLYLQATFKLPSTYRHKGESPPTSIDNNKVRHFLILFHNHIFIKRVNAVVEYQYCLSRYKLKIIVTPT